jgi:hypothetical protein
MICPPPQEAGLHRVSRAADYGSDVGQQIKDVVRTAVDDASGAQFGRAVNDLKLLGKDDLAIQMWELADEHHAGAAASRAVLDLLFQRRDAERFMRAWGQLPHRDSAAVDMLWHLLGPRLASGGSGMDPDWLLQLQSAIRHPMPWVDLERLGPALSRAFGKPHVQDVIQRESDKLTNVANRPRLEELMRQYR